MEAQMDKGSLALSSLIQGADYLPVQSELVLNGSSCRVLGSTAASATSIMVLCNCAACATRPMAGLFRHGGRVMSLHDWCIHTSLGGASFERLSVRQWTADYLVPLPAWLRAAALHMGGDALKRKQLSVFWWDAAPEGPVQTVPPPPCHRFFEPKRASGAWRAATVVGFEPRTGLSTLKYHSDPKKQVSKIFLPLALIHFARMAPPLGNPLRNVAEGYTPLPALLLPSPDAASIDAPTAPDDLWSPSVMAPTHPVLLVELQAQQQQRQQLPSQQPQHQMIQQRQEQQLQELQQQLCQIPHGNLLMSVQLHELQQHKPQLPQMHQHQPQLQLRQQLQQQYLLQQQQRQQPQQQQPFKLRAADGATWSQDGCLRKRKPAGTSGGDSDGSSPVKPWSRPMSPVSYMFGSSSASSPTTLPIVDEALGGGATASPGGTSVTVVPLPSAPPPHHQPSLLLPIRQFMDVQEASAAISGSSSCSGNGVQRSGLPAALSRFGSTADLTSVTSPTRLMQPDVANIQTLAPAAVTAEAAAFRADSDLLSAAVFPPMVSGLASALAKAVAPAPPPSSSSPLTQTASVPGPWPLGGSGGGAWNSLQWQLRQQIPSHQQQPNSDLEVTSGPVHATGSMGPRPTSSIIDADFEKMFQALDSSAWSNPSEVASGNAVLASRINSGPLPSPFCSIPSPQPSRTLSLQQQQQQQSSLLEPQLSQPLPATNCLFAESLSATGSPPKRARLNCCPVDISHGSIHSFSNAGSFATKITNPATTSTTYDNNCNSSGGDGSSNGGMLHHNFDWTSILIEARLFDSPTPAPGAVRGDVSIPV